MTCLRCAENLSCLLLPERSLGGTPHPLCTLPTATLHLWQTSSVAPISLPPVPYAAALSPTGMLLPRTKRGRRAAGGSIRQRRARRRVAAQAAARCAAHRATCTENWRTRLCPATYYARTTMGRGRFGWTGDALFLRVSLLSLAVRVRTTTSIRDAVGRGEVRRTCCLDNIADRACNPVSLF